MDEIFQRIQIVPLDKCLIHEGVIEKCVAQIASHIQNDGFLKNPIIVTQHKDHHVILDGMHRFVALAELKAPDILVYEVDYFSNGIVLKPPFTKKEVLKRALTQKILPPKSTTHIISNRPLRVDLDLALLRSDLDLETKNKRLQAHLKECVANHHVRFYPESVYLFGD